MPKLYFQSQFSMSKINGIFSKKNSFKNINLGDNFLKKTFFFNYNFWTTLFSKIMPNFWRTGAPSSLKIQRFPLSMLILGQKPCILGPTIFKIPQPNWHYCLYDVEYVTQTLAIPQSICDWASMLPRLDSCTTTSGHLWWPFSSSPTSPSSFLMLLSCTCVDRAEDFPHRKAW